MSNLISTVDKNPHVVIRGMAYMAIQSKGLRGCKVIHVLGKETQFVTDQQIKEAFVLRNGGHFRKNRWYK